MDWSKKVKIIDWLMNNLDGNGESNNNTIIIMINKLKDI